MGKHRGKFLAAAVSCYAGYKGEEIPRSFVLQGTEHHVTSVLECWYERSFSSFSSEFMNWRVMAGDNREYILRYDQQEDRWEARGVED